jgi:serine protease Do
VAESIGLAKAQGALVRSVESGSPAEKAGVEAGDIITRFEGKPIEKASDLPRLVGNTKPGSRSAITVFRRGQPRDLTLTVAELEPEQVARRPAARSSDAPKAAGAAQAMGITVAELTDAQKRELKVKRGVRVEAAADAAARAGLREGDVILSVGNAEVGSAREFEAAVAKADKSKTINMLVQRGELVQYVLIRPTR